MAQKHKSKYKSPTDLEKSQKPKPRKDLKDYTHDDKDEKLNPYSTEEKQKNVLRKTDKPVIDNGDMVPELKDADRAYLPDGKHDVKHAAKVMSKRQEEDEKANKKNIKDKIENLTREQKEHIIRQYVRNTVARILKEQEEAEPTEEPIEEPAATEEPAAPEATPAAPVAATPAPAAEEPQAEPAPTEEPTEEPAETEEAPAEETTDVKLQQFLKLLDDQPSSKHKIGLIVVALDKALQDAPAKTKYNMYTLLKLAATNKLKQIQ